MVMKGFIVGCSRDVRSFGESLESNGIRGYRMGDKLARY
jgi:hypothetical protein